MFRIGSTILSTVGVLLIPGPALAQDPPARVTPPRVIQTADQTTTAPYNVPNPQPSPQPQPLFTIGDLPARVWAPVAPPYNGAANRTNAANPAFQEDAY
jgi:hypothetical protein